MASQSFTIRVLGPDDVALMEGMSTMFGQAFGEPDTYGGARPSAAYLPVSYTHLTLPTNREV